MSAAPRQAPVASGNPGAMTMRRPAAESAGSAAMLRAAGKRCVSVGNPRPSQRLEEEELRIVEEVRLGIGVVGGSLVVADLSAPLEKPRIRGLICLHFDSVLIGSPIYTVSGPLDVRVYSRRHFFTCGGDWRDISRSCCRVLSIVVCFWKFWRAFEGPQRASAIVKWFKESTEEKKSGSVM